MKSFLYIVCMLISLNGLSQIQLVFNVTPPSCSGCSDAAIETSIAGCMAGGFTMIWIGPDGFTHSDPNITNLLTGVYSFSLTDANGTTVETEVTIPDTGTVFTQTENFMIDCFWGGGSVPLRCIYFPPTSPGEFGEACILLAPCTVFPVLVAWYDENASLVSSSDCLEATPSSIYTVTVTDADNQTGSFTVDLTEGGDFGMLTEEFCEPSSTAEHERSSGLWLFPNPGLGLFTLHWEGHITGSSYILSDALGRVIEEERLQATMTSIALEGSPAGTYFVMIRSPEGNLLHIKRFILVP